MSEEAYPSGDVDMRLRNVTSRSHCLDDMEEELLDDMENKIRAALHDASSSTIAANSRRLDGQLRPGVGVDDFLS